MNPTVVSPMFCFLATFFLLIRHIASLTNLTVNSKNLYLTSYLNFLDYQIYDLVSTNNTGFNNEASNWLIINLLGATRTSTCDNQPMLGGYNVLGSNGYFKRMYSNLPPHDMIYFEIKMFIQESWVGTDTVTVDIDGTSQTIGEISKSVPVLLRFPCSPSSTHSTIYFEGKVNHNSDTVVLKVISNANNPSTAYFGIRDVKLQFLYKQDPNEPDSSCNYPENSVFVDKVCPCARSYYKSDLNCEKCPQGCNTCYGNSPSQCFQCIPSAGYFFYDGGCWQACNNGTYFYPNHACVPTCDSPLIPSYLRVATTQEYDMLKCDSPCSKDEYLYPNGTCGVCKYPLVIKIENGINRCVPPCNETNYYYQAEETCKASCDPPMVVEQYDLYNKCVSVPPKEIEEVKKVTVVNTAISNVLGAATAVAMIAGSANPATSTLSGFVKMLPYIRYIDIHYPPKLQQMLDNLNSTVISFSFGVPLPSEIEEQFVERPLPSTSKFGNYDYHSSFFINYWPTMSSLIILMGVALVFTLCAFVTRKYKKVSHFFKAMRPIIQWNFVLMIFCGNFDSIIIPTSLELRTIVFDTVADGISFIFCIGFNLIILFCFYLAFHIVRDIRRAKSQVSPSGIKSSTKVFPDEKWKEFQLFFKGSKDDSVITHMYIIPYLARLCLFNLVIAHLYEHPLAQAIIIVILSVAIITSMLWLKPFISNVVFYQHISDEMIMFVVNTSMLILATLDYNDIDGTETRVALGDIIIYSNLVFNFSSNFFLIVYLFNGFKAAYNNFKQNKEKGVFALFIALLAPYEAGGMDVEIADLNESPVNEFPKLHNSNSIQDKIAARHRRLTVIGSAILPNFNLDLSPTSIIIGPSSNKNQSIDFSKHQKTTASSPSLIHSANVSLSNFENSPLKRNFSPKF